MGARKESVSDLQQMVGSGPLLIHATFLLPVPDYRRTFLTPTRLASDGPDPLFGVGRLARRPFLVPKMRSASAWFFFRSRATWRDCQKPIHLERNPPKLCSTYRCG